jgi:hypothetical protein
VGKPLSEQNQAKDYSKTFLDAYYRLPQETFEFFARSTDVCMKMYNSWLKTSDLLLNGKPESKQLSNIWAKDFEDIYNNVFEVIFRPMKILAGMPITNTIASIFDLINWPGSFGPFGGLFPWLKPYENLISLYPKKIPQLFSKVVDSYSNFYVSWKEYYSTLHKAWLEATNKLSKEFIKNLNSKKDTETSMDFWNFYNLWMETYQKTYTDLFSLPEIITIQTQLTSSMMDIIKHWRDLLEAILSNSPSFPLSTKSEMDDVYKRIYFLQKEIDEISKRFEEQKPPFTQQTKKS